MERTSCIHGLLQGRVYVWKVSFIMADGVEHMPKKSISEKDHMPKDTLPPEIIERVCRLNTCLTEAANWIEECTQKTKATYFAGGGKEDYHEQDESWEDYELEAIVKCSLGNDDPAFNPDDEYGNMIVVCETRLAGDQSRELTWSSCWNEYYREQKSFQLTRSMLLSLHDKARHSQTFPFGGGGDP
jgi:hypothetical protein